MKSKTLKYYEIADTKLLKLLLTTYENHSEHLENFEDEEKMIDYEIDIHLIRMELNKRLWKEKK